MDLDQNLSLARQQCLHRLLNAMLRENLLSLSTDTNPFRIPLEQQGGYISIDQVTLSELSRYQIKGNVFYCNPNSDIQSITDPLILLGLIRLELNPAVNQKQWQHFLDEIVLLENKYIDPVWSPLQ